MMDKRVQQAVYNNAVWCDTVCRAHGWPGEFYEDIWVQWHGSLPYYPNAVTLTDECNLTTQRQAIQHLADARLPEGCGAKDSFCVLDLAPLGFEPLFEATWLYRPATLPPPIEPIQGVQWRRVQEATELRVWERAWRGAPGEETGEEPARLFLPTLLTYKQVVFLAAYQAQEIVAGAILNRTDSVVGLSNLFVPDKEQVSWWSSCVAAASELFPGLPLVGYEHGQELAYAQQCGFVAIGPLRIWIKVGEAL